jgi:hypothetical protein
MSVLDISMLLLLLLVVAWLTFGQLLAQARKSDFAGRHCVIMD